MKKLIQWNRLLQLCTSRRGLVVCTSTTPVFKSFGLLKSSLKRLYPSVQFYPSRLVSKFVNATLNQNITGLTLCFDFSLISFNNLFTFFPPHFFYVARLGNVYWSFKDLVLLRSANLWFYRFKSVIAHFVKIGFLSVLRFCSGLLK